MGGDHHIYRPLQPGEIRLLKPVTKGNDGLDDFSSFSFHYHSLFDDDPSLRYAALSYRWGSITAPHGVLIEGRPVSVTENLWNALQDLPHHLRNFRIWVDALCINQKDVVERNLQVQVMKDIFSKAEITMSYLGPDKDWGCATVTTELANDLYWTRMWILPEFLIAHEVELYSGKDRMRWQEFSEYATAETIRSGESLGVAQQLCYDRKARAVDKPPPICNLFALLQRYGHAQCADPRDKVFSLLSLHQYVKGVGAQIDVDYDTTVMELC